MSEDKMREQFELVWVKHENDYGHSLAFWNGSMWVIGNTQKLVKNRFTHWQLKD